MTNGDDDDENDDDDGLFCLVTDKRFRRYKVEWYRLGRATTEQYLYSSSSSRKKKVHLAISSLFSIAHLNFVWVLRMFVYCLLLQLFALFFRACHRSHLKLLLFVWSWNLVLISHATIADHCYWFSCFDLFHHVIVDIVSRIVLLLLF